jgi:hypothetical protein
MSYLAIDLVEDSVEFEFAARSAAVLALQSPGIRRLPELNRARGAVADAYTGTLSGRLSRRREATVLAAQQSKLSRP